MLRFLLLCNYIIYIVSVHTITGNDTLISISAVNYYPSSLYSKRIDKLLRSYQSSRQISPSFPENDDIPMCSIEVLSFISETSPNNDRRSNGSARLMMSGNNFNESEWNCIFGSVKSTNNPKPNLVMWSSVMHCVSIDNRDCGMIKNSIALEESFCFNIFIDTPETIYSDAAKSLAISQLRFSSDVELKKVGNSSVAVKRYSAVGSHTLTIKRDVHSHITSHQKFFDYRPRDKCSKLWTSDRIVGRCFGLITHSEYLKFKNISVVKDEIHCRSLCCDLGNKCQSWQYWIGIQLCKLGDQVRIGKETGIKSPYWCDDHPPVVWSGRKYVRSDNSVSDSNNNSQIIEESAELTTQCFGLGSEYLRQGHKPSFQTAIEKTEIISTRLNIKECEEVCRNSNDCNIWQAHATRGCYISKIKNAYCEPYTGNFTGGRKKRVSK